MLHIGLVKERFPLRAAALAFTLCLAIFVCGCNTGKKDARIFEAGEKAQVDRITCSVVDTQLYPKLDDGPDTRVPQDRFYLAQISLFNGGNSDYTVPTLTLVDDQGHTYPELADGRGVPAWVGVSRKLSPGETLQGNVVFDAPVRHYKLRISDEFAEVPVFVDLPLGFVHEKSDVMPKALEPDDNSMFKGTPSQSLPRK